MYHITRNRPYGAYMKSKFTVSCSRGCINVKHWCCDGMYKTYRQEKKTYQKINHSNFTNININNKLMRLHICPSFWPMYKYQNMSTVKKCLVIQKHSIHVSSAFYDEDSKEKLKVLEQDERSRIEEYVEHQKQKEEKKKKIIAAKEKFSEAFIYKVDQNLTSTGGQAVEPAQPSAIVSKKPLSTRIIDEVKHYYNGFKLLYLDTKVAARLLWKYLNGKTLSRRESKQFRRTVADLFRLVPFSIFIIIPFMEFLLPIAIKLFPGMLPSTFEDAKTKENKRRASLKVRLQMAEFLQDTIEEISVSTTEKGKKKSTQKLKEFAKFVQKTRTDSDPPSNGEIIKYSKLFEDEVTLENIPHDHLKALCRIMMISPLGISNFLRYRINLKLKQLKADDQMIRSEGIDSLSNEELQNACINRGMRSFGVSVDRLKLNLRQWLELSLDQKIPSSLLLLSRTFYMQYDRVDEQLKLTISQLPERLIDEMEVKIGGENVDRQTIIDIIKHEEEQIKTEKLLLDKEKADEQLSKEELLQVLETLSVSVKEKLDEIKEEREEYIGDVQELKEVKKDAVESVTSTRLGKRIDVMLKNVSKEEDKVSELPSGKIDEDEDGVVTTEEVLEAIKNLRNAPNEERTQNLLKVMDEDNDGVIDLDEMRTAVQLLASEDLELSQLQIKEVLSLLKDIERIFIIDQIINKRKTNYLIKLLPSVYRRKIFDKLN